MTSDNAAGASQSPHERLTNLESRLKEYLSDLNYTKQYTTIGRTTHVRSAQSFGAPALIQHVAFWPRSELDPAELDAAAMIGPRFREAAREDYNNRRERLIEDVNRLLKVLQDKGRIERSQSRFRVEKFELLRPVDWHSSNQEQPVNVPAVDSISFSVWWADGSAQTSLAGKPTSAHIRVRVQADVYPDFATVTFIIDAGKRWNLPAYPSDADHAAVDGERRKRIYKAAGDVRRISAAQMHTPASIALDVLPETTVSEGDAKTLFGASKVLYDDIWDEFADTFLGDPMNPLVPGHKRGLAAVIGKTDKAFAHFKGVALAVPVEGEFMDGRLARFAERDDLNNIYPNKVVKSYWPFIRRTRSEADDRDWIACGVFDFRALYITSLGGQSEYFPGDDIDGETPAGAPPGADSEIPSGHLPPRMVVEKDLVPLEVRETMKEIKSQVADAATATRLAALAANVEDWPTTEEGDRPAPYRYLFLTAGEPHRKQLGRMVDRVNQLGTIRLYALKNWSIIRDADVHIRVYGQLLDAVMQKSTDDAGEIAKAWSEKETTRVKDVADGVVLKNALDEVAKADAKFNVDLSQFRNDIKAIATLEQAERVHAQFRWLLEDGSRHAAKVANAAMADVFQKAHDDARQSKARRDEKLALANRAADVELTRIKTYLDALGNDAIGGLTYRINRAALYADIYRTAAPTLRVGTIDTWWDYNQLTARGVEPTFRFIAGVGTRLAGLRSRLRDAMEAVQTSAIANQTEATRDNTWRLERIAESMRKIGKEMEELNAKVAKSKLFAARASGFYSVLEIVGWFASTGLFFILLGLILQAFGILR